MFDSVCAYFPQTEVFVIYLYILLRERESSFAYSIPGKRQFSKCDRMLLFMFVSGKLTFVKFFMYRP